MGCATSCYFKLSKILSFTAFRNEKRPKTCITVHSSRARNLLACFDCLEIVDYRGSDPRIELGSQGPWVGKTYLLHKSHLRASICQHPREVNNPRPPFRHRLWAMQPAWPSWNFFLGDWKDDEENYVEVSGKTAVIHNRRSGWRTYLGITADDWGRWRCGDGVLQSSACRRCEFEKSFWRTHDRTIDETHEIGRRKRPRKAWTGLDECHFKTFWRWNFYDVFLTWRCGLASRILKLQETPPYKQRWFTGET